MILLIDNFDSFTYNLVDYFGQLGERTHVVRNTTSIQKIADYAYKGVVLSPGPEVPRKAGKLMEYIHYYQNKLPMLGICLGHQAIGQYFGATLQKAIKPMHGKVSKLTRIPDQMFGNMPVSFEVVRYHSLVLSALPNELIATAETSESELMAMRHRSLPIWGLQYHPEAALSQFGLDILKNWLVLNRISVEY